MSEGEKERACALDPRPHNHQPNPPNRQVVFLKASWHVGEPFADKYAHWATRQHRGLSNAEGVFDNAMYIYAITCGPGLVDGATHALCLSHLISLPHLAVPLLPLSSTA